MSTQDTEIETYWKKSGIEKPQPNIVAAACKFGPVILCGARHFDSVMHTQIIEMGGVKKLRKQYGHEEQGFIDQFGTFYNRVDALEVVKKSGQPFNAKRNSSKTRLFSEGLYW